MKFATITLFLAGLAVAIPVAQSPSPISGAIAAKMENYLAEKIRSIDPASIADQAMKDLQPAIAKALNDYAGKIKIAQRDVIVAAQRAAIEKRDPQAASASLAGPMAAASEQLKKVSEDVGITIGTMIGKSLAHLLSQTNPHISLPYALLFVHTPFHIVEILSPHTPSHTLFENMFISLFLISHLCLLHPL
jgi:hypothetical protein